ncbi:Uncharacterized protein {ECO:0000313/EMBL:CCF11832.1} [Pantoea ananatis]|nr:Uncharacterized protein {ECO:0000313/EMBL:CCF11832.1} [Pantoea ananatis]
MWRSGPMRLANDDGKQDKNDCDSYHLNKNPIKREFTHSVTSRREYLPDTQSCQDQAG